MANGTEFTEVWESDCGPGSSGKLACAHCDIYYSWGNGQSWPREANLNILTDIVFDMYAGQVFCPYVLER